MSNEELTEEEQRLVREGIDVIPVRIKVYLGKYFNKIHKYECINLDTDKMFVLQTADTGLGFEADKCYTIPILKSDKEFKNLADSRTMNGRFLELIYPIDEKTRGLMDVVQNKPEQVTQEQKDNYHDTISRLADTIPEPIVIRTTAGLANNTGAWGNKILDQLEASKKVVSLKNEFEEMDLRDEKQIIQEMKGDMIKEYAYSFIQDGRQVTGISYAGIKAIISKEGGFEDLDFIIEDTEKEFRCRFKAKDNKMNNISLGYAIQSKLHKNGGINKFAELTVFSKARRNAYRSLLDEAPIKNFVDKWLKENKK